MVPVAASNRTGTETIDDSSVTFYGSSFITDNTGRIAAQMDRSEEGVIVETVDLASMAAARQGWGLFRDRRPEHYGVLMTSDGVKGSMSQLRRIP
jgi:N-carbamoylputrescine amidase